MGVSPPRSVRAIALGILVRVERDRAHAAKLLDSKGSGLEPRDRDLLRHLVKTTLRFAIRLDHVLDRSLSRPIAGLDVPVRAALRLGAAQLLHLTRIPAHAAVGETVEALKAVQPQAAGLVNAVLRRLVRDEEPPGAVRLRAGSNPIEALAIETSHPRWLVERWVTSFGETRARQALEADNVDSPIDLLIDPRDCAADDVVQRLHEQGVETTPSPFAPLARTVLSMDGVGRLLAGSCDVSVVDSAAQGLVEVVKPAEVVLDLTAAPGGKARTLVARGHARRVIAVERQASRAVRMSKAVAAAGRGDAILCVLADSKAPPFPNARFDSILLDAPCSGTGTLRKNPETRTRLRETDLAAFALEQRALLKKALGLLCRGGQLTYTTCSLEPEENEEVVQSVLREEAGFGLDSEALGRLPAPFQHAVLEDGFLRLLPGPTHDGFSGCVLRRRQ